MKKKEPEIKAEVLEMPLNEVHIIRQRNNPSTNQHDYDVIVLKSEDTIVKLTELAKKTLKELK